MGKSFVGIDIGTSGIQLAELTRVRGALAVRNFGGVELPRGAVKDGELMDLDEVSGALRELMSTTGVRNRDVVLGMGNPHVIVREVDLPFTSEEELASGLAFQVQEYLPIAIEDARLDHHIVETFTTPEGERMVRLLLVAASRDVVDAMVTVAQRAKLRPLRLDLNAFAVLRALEGESKLTDAGTEVLIDIGGSMTNLVVHERGQPKYVRILGMGGNQLTDGLSTDLDMTLEVAEKTKRETGVAEQAGTDVSVLLRHAADDFIHEIRGTLDFFHAKRGFGRIDRVLLSGGGSLLSGLSQRMSDVLRVPVQHGHVLNRIEPLDTDLTEAQLRGVEPVLVTAVGLAMAVAG